MKNILIIVCLLFSGFTMTAQSTTTNLVENVEKKDRVIYGGLFGRVTEINEDFSVSTGARGGFMLNENVGVGIVGAGDWNRKRDRREDVTGINDDNLGLTMKYAGLFGEYFIAPAKKLNVSFPLAVMAGRTQFREEIQGIETTQSFILVLEPTININYKMSKNIMLSWSSGYRLVQFNDLEGVSNSDLSEFFTGLEIRFGSF